VKYAKGSSVRRQDASDGLKRSGIDASHVDLEDPALSEQCRCAWREVDGTHLNACVRYWTLTYRFISVRDGLEANKAGLGLQDPRGPRLSVMFRNIHCTNIGILS
jgi:hypothetical protein